MAEIEIDLDALPSLDQAGALEALIAAAQAKVAAESIQEQNEYVGPELPLLGMSQDSMSSPNGTRSTAASEGHRVEDRMQTWWKRRNEKIDALRRQIEEEQRAAELHDSTPTMKRYNKVMSNSTMEERLRDWHRKREAKVADLKKQLEELETKELVFHPQTLRASASASTGAKSSTPAIGSHVDLTAREDVQHFLARQEAARRRKAEAMMNEATPKYTGLPTIPKSPAFRTEQRAVMRGSATPGSPRGASTLIPGPLVGLPPGTYAQAPPGMIFTPISTPSLSMPMPMPAVASPLGMNSYAGPHPAPLGTSPRSGRGSSNIQTIPLHTVVADLAPSFAYPAPVQAQAPNGYVRQASSLPASTLADLDAAVREEQATVRHERVAARQSGVRAVAPSGAAHAVTVVVTPPGSKGAGTGQPVTLETLSLRDLYANPAIMSLVSPNGAPSR